MRAGLFFHLYHLINTQQVKKIILASSSKDESDSDSDSDIETEGTIESDIEEDTQFVLPSTSPELMLIGGGFINLQTYGAYSRDIKTPETSSYPISVEEPQLNPDWFRPELNPQFMTLKDRKLQYQRSLSLSAERKFNRKRQQQRKSYYGVAVRGGKEFYHPYPQLRDKFHHAPSVGVPIPKTLADEMDNLAINSNHRKRIKTFRDSQKLPPQYVEVASIKLREHVIDPDTKMIKGTFGKRLEIRRKKKMKRNSTLKPFPHRKGFILYNSKTNLVAFYEEKTRRLVTYFDVDPDGNQAKDIISNQNIL